MLGAAISTLQHQQLVAFVYQVRTKEFGDWMIKIHAHPMRSCSLTDDRTFLKFFLNHTTAHDVETIIGWGHPDLIHLMKYGPCPMFVDCTFSCVPSGFKQLLIVMIYTAATGMNGVMYTMYEQLNLHYACTVYYGLMYGMC
jgi:hypothetical protein